MSVRAEYEVQWRDSTYAGWDHMHTAATLAEARDYLKEALIEEPPAEGEKFRIVKTTITTKRKIVKVATR